MTKLEKGMKLEEEMTCKGYLYLLNRIKARGFDTITDEERVFLILNFMSLSIVYVDSLKEAYDTIKVLNFDKELELSAKKNPKDKIKLQFVSGVKELITKGKRLNSILNCMFQSEDLQEANNNMIEEHLKFHDKIMKMPHFTRQKAIKLVNALGDDEEVMDDNELPELKELHNLYVKADLKQDFVNYCKTYFKY